VQLSGFVVKNINPLNKNIFNKWVKDLKRYIKKEEIEMSSKHMKRCSTSLDITDMKIKSTMRYNFQCTRMAIIKKRQK